MRENDATKTWLWIDLHAAITDGIFTLDHQGVCKAIIWILVVTMMCDMPYLWASAQVCMLTERET